MANTYDAEAQAPAEPVAEEPVAGEGAKSTQEECNYRAGTPIKNCGLCGHYFGNAGSQQHTCEVVEGSPETGDPISQFDYCDFYEREENPRPQRLGPREVGMINEMMQSAPDQSPHAQASAPTTTIGSRTYR